MDVVRKPVNTSLQNIKLKMLSEKLFDADYYLKCYPDVKKSGIDPLEHYIIHGLKEGRSPHPSHFFKSLDDIRAFVIKKATPVVQQPKMMDVQFNSVPDLSKRIFKTLPALTDKKISVIIPTIWKRKDLTLALIDHLVQKQIETILVDNTGKTIDFALPESVKYVSYNHPFNFSKINNYGATFAAGNILLFLNDDLEVIQDDWISCMLDVFDDLSVGMVGPVVYLPNGSVPGAGARMRLDGSGVIGVSPLPVENRISQTIGGMCMMIRRDVFDEVGGFDEDFIITHSDTALGLAVNDCHYKVIVTPHSKVKHYERSSRPATDLPEDTETFFQKYGKDILSGYSELGSLSSQTILIESPYIDIHSIKTGVIVKTDHIGDIYIALPSIRRLMSKFPKTEWTVICGSWAEGIFRHEGFKNIVTVNIFGENGVMGGFKGLSAEDREKMSNIFCDFAVDFRTVPDSRFLLNVLHAKMKYGFPAPAFTSSVEFPLHFDMRTLHNGQHLMMMVENLLIYEKKLPKQIKTIVLVPAASTKVKLPPLDLFIDVGKELKRMKFHVIIAGGPNDKSNLDIVASKLKAPIIPFVPVELFGEYVQQRADLAIVGDSGPGHILASTGMPVVEIMGGLVPQKQWGSFGPNVKILTTKIDCAPCYSLSCKPGLNYKCLNVPTKDVLYAIGEFIHDINYRSWNK